MRTNMYSWGRRAAAVAAVACACLLGGRADAAVITEDFSASGPFVTGYGSSSSGWASGWTVAGSHTVSSGELVIEGVDNNNLAYRHLANPLTEDFYFSFSLDVSGMTSVDQNDFLTFWFNDDHETYNGSTGLPSIGLRGNENKGSGSNDLMVRLYGSGGNHADYDFEAGVDKVGIVGKLSKVGSVYDKFELWVIEDLLDFPDFDELGEAHATASGGGFLSAITTIGLRTANLESDDVLRLGDIQVTTAPEPATIALWGLGSAVGLAFGARRKRRATEVK